MTVPEPAQAPHKPQANADGQVRPCPTPRKAGFPSRPAAVVGAGSEDAGLSPYLCPCGRWHLTKTPKKVFDRAALRPGAGDELLLADADDHYFTAVVERDLRDNSTLEEALSLRHRAHRRRWQEALKTLFLGTETQLAARAGDRSPSAARWRTNLAVYREGIRRRRAEARQRIAEEYARPVVVPEQRARRKARQEAAPAAVQRLIDAHPEEFARYLDEEAALIEGQES